MTALRRPFFLLFLFGFGTISAALFCLPPAGATELTVPHAGTVPEVPRIDFPKILDGRVFAMAEVGHWIVVGGDFQQLELQDGRVITRPHLVAFDRDTGALVDEFEPAPNRPVHAIAPGLAGNEMFVGGRFSQIDGHARAKLAKVALPDGSVDPRWIANVSAKVTSIDITSDQRMFVGGSFKKVKGTDHDNLAEIDPVTDEVIAAFEFAFTGEGGSRSGGQHVKHVEATPDGDRLVVVHSASHIDGNQRLGAAIFDISDQNTPFLTDYSVNSFFLGAPRGALPVDGDMSPDGSFFAMTTIIGNSPPWHDMVLAFPTTGGPNTSPIWTHAMRDSTYSVAISDNAVYAGGHFCRIASGPGPTNDDGLVKNCSGTNQQGAWRWQIAALNPADGTPLDWDPGSNSFHGVQELTVTDRGLLVGHDGSSLGNRNVGRAGFFDFGPSVLDSSEPTVDITAPTPAGLFASPLTVAGTAVDDYRVERVRIRLFNTATSQYVQSDGSLDAALYEFFTQPAYGDPGSTVDWAMQTPLPDGPYRVTAWAIDPVGNNSTSEQFTFTVGEVPPATCTATLDGNGGVDLAWSEIVGADPYAVRRDAVFVANVSGGVLTYNDPAPEPGDHSYVIRSRMAGVTTDVPCEPDPITVDPPTLTCTAALHGNGGVILTWDGITGEDTYIVRRDNAFLASVGGGGLTYTDPTPGAGDHSYLIRSRMAGVTTDVICQPDPITI